MRHTAHPPPCPPRTPPCPWNFFNEASLPGTPARLSSPTCPYHTQPPPPPSPPPRRQLAVSSLPNRSGAKRSVFGAASAAVSGKKRQAMMLLVSSIVKGFPCWRLLAVGAAAVLDHIHPRFGDKQVISGDDQIDVACLRLWFGLSYVN